MNAIRYPLAAVFLVLVFRSPAFSKEVNCLSCHEALSKGKVVHAALKEGCPTCHGGIDARVVPHGKTNDLPKGLSSKQPGLCFDCHDKGEFGKKKVHDPVAEGSCTTCHNPHASEFVALLTKEPIRVCLECHSEVRKKPHAVTGFGSAGHPIGLLRRGQKDFADDPARKGRKFYCGSCHNPHSSDFGRLFRYPAKLTYDLCTQCHKM